MAKMASRAQRGVALCMTVRVPVVLSRDEDARIMKQLDGVTWIMVTLLYGAGLRLQECLELRVKAAELRSA
jgi:site-specific recombinase XerD